MSHPDYDELVRLAKKEKNSRKRIRYLAVANFLECGNRAEVARQLKVARRSVNDWVSGFLENGITALDDNYYKGKRRPLSEAQEKQLSDYINRHAASDEGGRLTGEDIKAYISQEFGISYHLNSIYRVLKRMGFSWITSRSKHPKQSPQAQEAFKKTLL